MSTLETRKTRAAHGSLRMKIGEAKQNSRRTHRCRPVTDGVEGQLGPPTEGRAERTGTVVLDLGRRVPARWHWTRGREDQRGGSGLVAERTGEVALGLGGEDREGGAGLVGVERTGEVVLDSGRREPAWRRGTREAKARSAGLGPKRTGVTALDSGWRGPVWRHRTQGRRRDTAGLGGRDRVVEEANAREY